MPITFKIEDGDTVVVPDESGETLLDAAKRAGVVIDAPCGGNGVCGKCRVKLISGALSGEKTKNEDDASFQDGWRLACAHKAQGDVTVLVPASARAFQNRIRITDFSGAREKAAFDNLRAALAGQNLSGDHGIEKKPLALTAPSPDDAQADRERVDAALAAASNTETPILWTLHALRSLPAALRQGNWSVTAVARGERNDTLQILDILPNTESAQPLAGLAVDIGTTTVSLLLVNLETGDPLASVSGGNAQIPYGADVINRIIESGKKGGLERLRGAIVNECLNPLIKRLCAAAGIAPASIYRAALAGNTTMTHLVLGVPPEYLRLDPYVPAFFDINELSAQAIGLAINPAAEVVAAPAIGSYVGGDITAGVLAADFYRKESFSLFIDLGTNGELVFGNNEFLFSCACSAGPAFEGGEISCGMRATSGAIEKCRIDEATGEPQFTIIGEKDTKPAGLCGSGLIDIIGELFRCGIINAKGKFIAEKSRVIRDEHGGAGYLVAGAAESAGGHDIILNESDIDNFIRAKGAIFSAIRTMLAIVDFSIDVIEDVYVAGGIGSGIDIEHAILIGMFPKLPLEKFKYIGNSSLSGAYAMLCSQKAAQKVREIARGITYLELSSHPAYMDEFVAACFLPHTNAGFFQ